MEFLQQTILNDFPSPKVGNTVYIHPLGHNLELKINNYHCYCLVLRLISILSLGVGEPVVQGGSRAPLQMG